jgi:hypothetical protein
MDQRTGKKTFPVQQLRSAAAGCGDLSLSKFMESFDIRQTVIIPPEMVGPPEVGVLKPVVSRGRPSSSVLEDGY